MDSRGLRSRCRVSTNQEGDRFVGLLVEEGRAEVSFPMGYRLSETEGEMRRDILQLLAVLSRLAGRREQQALPGLDGKARREVETPVGAYLELIGDYLSRGGYYTEQAAAYRSGDRGRTDWTRTLRRQRPLLQEDLSPIYLRRTVRSAAPDTRRLITRIHRYCVWESFAKLGWLFTAELPRQERMPLPAAGCLAVLRSQLGRTFADRDKRLFSAMIAMLEYLGEGTAKGQFRCGTDRFEYVWERLVDRAFGVSDKERYFPRAVWHLRAGQGRTAEALRPDTIMRRRGALYVLDAKYYRYGITGNPAHLPPASSIHKQITYGEYVSTRFGGAVYNAFLLPCCAADGGPYASCGEATGWWKSGEHPYERVQGILTDVRFLLHCAPGCWDAAAEELAETIERAAAENRRLFPDERGEG